MPIRPWDANEANCKSWAASAILATEVVVAVLAVVVVLSSVGAGLWWPLVPRARKLGKATTQTLFRGDHELVGRSFVYMSLTTVCAHLRGYVFKDERCSSATLQRYHHNPELSFPHLYITRFTSSARFFLRIGACFKIHNRFGKNHTYKYQSNFGCAF